MAFNAVAQTTKTNTHEKIQRPPELRIFQIKTARVELSVTVCPACPLGKSNVAQSKCKHKCQAGPGISKEVHITSAHRSATDLL